MLINSTGDQSGQRGYIFQKTVQSTGLHCLWAAQGGNDNEKSAALLHDHLLEKYITFVSWTLRFTDG